MTEPLKANVRILGVFYRPDKPLLFSVEVKDHPEITYAEVPEKDAEFRMMAQDVGKPLKQFCLDWNDRQIEIERQHEAELEKRGLLFRMEGKATAPEASRKFFGDMAKDFYEANGIDMEPD